MTTSRRYSHGQTYNRAPVIRRQKLHDDVEFVIILLLAFAVGCALVSLCN